MIYGGSGDMSQKFFLKNRLSEIEFVNNFDKKMTALFE